RAFHVTGVQTCALPIFLVAALWAWPLAAPHPVVRAYLAPPAPYAAGHRGIDIRSSPAAEVRAPADGVVHFAGVVVDRAVLSIDQIGRASCRETGQIPLP